AIVIELDECVDLAAVLIGEKIFGIELDCFAVIRNRVVVILLVVVRRAAMEISLGTIGRAFAGVADYTRANGNALIRILGDIAGAFLPVGLARRKRASERRNGKSCGK